MMTDQIYFNQLTQGLILGNLLMKYELLKFIIMNRAIYAKSATKKPYDLSQNLKLPLISNKKDKVSRILSKNYSNYEDHIPTILSSKKSLNANNLSTQLDERANKKKRSHQVGIDKLNSRDNTQAETVDKIQNFGDDFENKINMNKEIIRKFKEQKIKQMKEIPDKRLNRNIDTPIKDKLNNQKGQNGLKNYRFSSDQKKKIEKASPRYNSIDLLTLNNKIKRSSPAKKVHKIIIPQNKNQQLFNKLQNFLADPRKNKQSSATSPRRNRQNNTKVQQRLKTLENHLSSINDQYSPRKNIYLQPLYEDSDICGDWRRVGFNKNQVEVVISNFEDEIQKLSEYQKKVEDSLEKYVQNHKDLLESQLYKRILQNLKDKQ